MKNDEINEEIKEEFCPPCLLAIPLAFAATSTGASVAIDGSNNTDTMTLKKILLWIGITVLSIASILLSVWFIFFRNCATCK